MGNWVSLSFYSAYCDFVEGIECTWVVETIGSHSDFPCSLLCDLERIIFTKQIEDCKIVLEGFTVPKIRFRIFIVDNIFFKRIHGIPGRDHRH